VTADIRKITVCRVAVPKLVGLGPRAWNKLRRAAQLLALGAAPAGCDGGQIGEAVSSHARKQEIQHSAASGPLQFRVRICALDDPYESHMGQCCY
jgi:hypothetical protein